MDGRRAIGTNKSKANITTFKPGQRPTKSVSMTPGQQEGEELKALLPIASKLNEKVIDTICSAIKAAAGHNAAAQLAGIQSRTLKSWLNRGEADPERQNGGGIYRELYERVMEADTIVITTLTGRIMKKTRTDWRAAAYMLEQLFPAEYGPKAAKAVKETEGGVAEVLIYTLDNRRDKPQEEQPQTLNLKAEGHKNDPQ